MEDLRRTVILTLTQDCNLACSYCFEHNKSRNNMDCKTAVDIIETEYRKLQENEILEIDFFGGEPFLEFDLIKEIVEYIEQSSLRDKVLFFVDTNGTLIDENIKKWLLNHEDNFICGLSYDGTPFMHDMNRCNSSSMIDLDFFAKVYPEQTIKMTVSVETLPYLASGIIFLEEKGFEVACNLAYGIDWSKNDNKYYLERELKKLIEHYLDNPQITPCSLLDRDICGISYNKDTKPRFCGAGINVVSYDVDGQAYPCQFFMPLSVGREKAEKSRSLTFFYENVPLEVLDPKCKDCIAKAICPTCYGANYFQCGNIYMQDDNYCNLQKIIIRAQSFFRAQQWRRGEMQLSIEEEHILLDSILAIQQKL